ncbi:hypothetical protein SRABI83_04602 [Arthrobacter sp. Bi83]|nr:hypothetical protein SRABI83_04602 [Arthrobacter sp. Bi83]
MRAIRAQAHCGTSAIQGMYLPKKFMYRAAAVMSTMVVVAQLIQ